MANPKRGCGHLKPHAVYMTAQFSAFGELPTFVQITPPIPHQEAWFRGVKYVNGLALDAVMGWAHADIDRERTPAYRLAPSCESQKLLARMGGRHFCARLDEISAALVGDGLVFSAEDVDREVDNLRAGKAYAPVNLGAFEEFWALDMLDWIGESHYPTPESFIEEAKQLGVNRRLPKGFFPRIRKGQTRVWFLHPKAIRAPGDRISPDQEEMGVGDDFVLRPGLIGYSYLTHLIYTAPPNQAVPEDMKKRAAAGEIEIVELTPPEEEIKPEDGTEQEDFLGDLDEEPPVISDPVMSEQPE
ncbi:MAG: hypothetical protein GWO44_18260 [Thermoplasmata archaeon]|nr:hypothetical protein [Thermoplasmata archaeon]NIY05143.1 hypothetical protein [Thermoplasmata archaeon]